MKKLVMTVVMMLGLMVGVSANNVSILDREIPFCCDNRNYDFSVNEKKLGNYLELKDSSAFHDMLNGLKEGMAFAGTIEDDHVRSRVVVNSIIYTVNGAGMTLNKSQYKRFMTVFNATLLNRGFNGEMEAYSQVILK